MRIGAYLHEPAPDIEVHFKPRDGESREHALQRYLGIHHHAMAAWKNESDARHGAVVDVSQIRRDVDWFYRARVKAPPESIRSLALAYRDRGDARRTVKPGIARAERLLGDVPVYVYPED